MTNKSVKKKNLIWALVALVAVVAIFAGVYFATRPDTAAGAKHITVTVVHKDATERVVEIDLSTLESTVALPHLPSNTRTVREVAGMHIDQVVIGSCTNGRISDLRIAAQILKGRKVADKVRFLVVPASAEIYRQALEEGILRTVMEAGAIVMNPNCSVCWGSCQGVIGEGETLISTGTRNFKGRAGHPGSFVYLASAETVTASAILGEIATAGQLPPVEG